LNDLQFSPTPFSPTRVAKVEADDSTVSIDLVVKSLLTLGVSKKELAKVIAKS